MNHKVVRVPRRPVLVAGILAVTLAILGTAVWLLGPSSGTRSDNGPLVMNDNQNVTSFSADPGDISTYGYVFIHNPGRKDAVLESAELVGPNNATVTVGPIGAVLQDRNQISGVGAARGYPSVAIPKEKVRDVPGLTVPAGGGVVELLFGVTPHKPGAYLWTGIRVNYRIESRRYVVTDDDKFALCSPRQVKALCLGY
jgi:hypothetical protein